MSENKVIDGVIVAFSYGMIAGSKKDPVTTHEVTENKGASEDAGSWSNKLFPPSMCGKRNSFTDLRRHLSGIRNYHYNSTFMWEDSLWRILPSRRIESYQKVVEQDGSKEANLLLDKFIEELPTLKDMAKLARGEAYQETDYPTPAQIRDKFVYRVQYRPIPNSAGLNPALMSEAIAELNELHSRRLAEANESLIRRFLEPMKNLADILQDPTKRRLSQVMGTIIDFTEQLPSLELSGNQELIQMAEQINGLFKEIKPETIKQDEAMRKVLGETVNSAIGALDRFGAMGQRSFA